MTAPIPGDFFERVRRIAQEEVARFFRSGPLRNSSITDGGLTIRGGFLRLISGAVSLFYVGPYGPAAPDGTPQQGMQLRRADGTAALTMYDAFPGEDGTFNQALTWWDRRQNQVFADDTDSGEGLARPYLPAVFYPGRFGDYLSTTSGSFETIWRAEMPKQHPRLRVAASGATDAAGTAGEMRCLVEGQPFGDTVTGLNSGTFTAGVWGPAFMDELAHMSTVHVEIQARRTAGTGAVRIAPLMAQGMQS